MGGSGGRRIFTTPFAAIHRHYVAKVERKGRSRGELDAAIRWLTGYEEAELLEHLAAGTTVEAFLAGARIPAAAEAITGIICGVRIEAVEDPRMRRIRQLDKLVDELAKGRPLERVLRG